MKNNKIQLDAAELAAATAEWMGVAPIERSHPVCRSDGDPLSAAVSAALAEWPAVHDALVARRAAKAVDFAAAAESIAKNE